MRRGRQKRGGKGSPRKGRSKAKTKRNRIREDPSTNSSLVLISLTQTLIDSPLFILIFSYSRPGLHFLSRGKKADDRKGKEQKKKKEKTSNIIAMLSLDSATLLSPAHTPKRQDKYGVHMYLYPTGTTSRRARANETRARRGSMPHLAKYLTTMYFVLRSRSTAVQDCQPKCQPKPTPDRAGRADPLPRCPVQSSPAGVPAALSWTHTKARDRDNAGCILLVA